MVVVVGFYEEMCVVVLAIVAFVFKEIRITIEVMSIVSLLVSLLVNC